MAFWDRKETPTPAAPEQPAPEQPAAPEPDRLARVEEALAGLAESQLRASTPSPQPQQFAPQLPPIVDVSDEDFDHAMEEGDTRRLRQLQRTREAANAERLRREFDQKVGQIAASGSAAINDLTKRSYLGSNPYYSKDPAFKKDVDALVGQVQGTGNILTTETLEWIVQKVTGQHHDRLVREHTERQTRQQREQPPTPQGRPRAGGGAPITPSEEEYELPAEAYQSLALLNRGRGRTPDEYAQELPRRRYRVTDVDANGRFRERIETYTHKSFGDVLKRRSWSEREYERQTAIMRGELSPFEPVTPRDEK